ncbi:MAG: F0F1 ATP synthase subunit epsilon [Pseudomonadota bacterium]|nr:F0F1 ATP synthase subunit epsilon [Pseudomonadota bacterium]|tara:strand:+ start:451 stop:870 length:420 start_codon:yes stop_codon:yes gene_type:complete
MAEDKVEFELVSPEKLLLSREVDMVVIPGAEGDMGVLPQHSPAITTVRPGTIVVYEGGAVTDRIFIAGGFAEVSDNRCTVLAEEAMPVEDIDKASAEQALSGARDDVGAAKNDSQRNAAETAVTVAEAKIQAVDSPAYS